MPSDWSPQFLLAALLDCPVGPEQIKYYEAKPHNTLQLTSLLGFSSFNFLPGGHLIGMVLFLAVVLERLGNSDLEKMFGSELVLGGNIRCKAKFD